MKHLICGCLDLTDNLEIISTVEGRSKLLRDDAGLHFGSYRAPGSADANSPTARQLSLSLQLAACSFRSYTQDPEPPKTSSPANLAKVISYSIGNFDQEE